VWPHTVKSSKRLLILKSPWYRSCWLDLYACGSLPVARSLQFAHQPRLLKLREHAGDLPHGDLKGILRGREIVARRGKHANASRDKGNDASLLDDELPCESRRILDQDRSHSVAL